MSLVLLIACANVAALLLVKATSRAREIAIRAAIGAGRRRIVRQLLTETLLLAVLGGAAGLILAAAGVKALVVLAPTGVPRLAETRIDGVVLAFTLGASALCSVFFGIVPALYASRIDLSNALKQGGGLREILVVAEIAFSVVLLAGAGLLIKSFVALNRVELGFRPERVLLMKATLSASGQEAEQRARTFFKQLTSDFLSLPGVAAVGATMGPPGHVESAGSYWIDRLPERMKSDAPDAVFSVVTPGTFAALGIPLKDGRDFEERDAADSPYTAVINEALARKAFPNQNPLGRTIFAGFDRMNQPMKIVGIVGDVRQWGPARKPEPEIYMPYDQHTSGAGATLNVVVRTAGAPGTLVNTLRRRTQKLSSDVPLKFTTMEESLHEEVAVPRFRTLLLGAFAGLALCLAMAGVYGVTSYDVGRRANEIGLRMAMGATRGGVLWLVLKQSMRLAILGMAFGFLGAIGGTRFMTGILFGVTPGDPGTYGVVAVVLGAMVLLSVYVPAHRAASLDPLVALKQE